jgi:flagellar basal body-associated protein FliL
MNPNNIQPPEKKKKNKLIIIIPLVIIFLVVAFVGYAFFTKSFFFKSGEDESVKRIEEQIFQMDEFVINLRDENARRYLKTSIVITYENKKELEKLKNNIPQMRDVIIETLRAKSVDDVMNVENSDILKNEIKDKVNELYEDEIVLEVYFINFLIQ